MGKSAPGFCKSSKIPFQDSWGVANALLKPPGGVVIERHSEGDDDDRAFVQIGPAKFMRTTDEEKSEVLEITVTGKLHPLTSQPLLSEPHLHEIRKLHIPRSHFHKSSQEARMYELPIHPFVAWVGDDLGAYLIDRGQQYRTLGRGTHLVTDESENVPGFADASVPHAIVAAALLTMLGIFSDSTNTSSTWQSTKIFNGPDLRT
jgi:hypothetical protein